MSWYEGFCDKPGNRVTQGDKSKVKSKTGPVNIIYSNTKSQCELVKTQK